MTIGPGGNARASHINLDLVSHLISVDAWGLVKYGVDQMSSESGSSLSGYGGGFGLLLSKLLSSGRGRLSRSSI